MKILYKIIIVFLLACLVVLGGFLLYEKYTHTQTRIELNNQVAELEGTLRETESAFSRRGVELEDLKVGSKELQNIIDSRDEDILALGDVVIEWRDRFFKIENAQQSIVYSDDTNSDDSSSHCGAGINNNARIKVSFEQEQDPIKISGFTLTSPPYAEIVLEWMRDLRLQLVLTKDDDRQYRLYIDAANSDIETAELRLTIDPSILNKRWYERLLISGDLLADDLGVLVSVRLGYEFDNWTIGPAIAAGCINGESTVLYGISVGWRPFYRR